MSSVDLEPLAGRKRWAPSVRRAQLLEVAEEVFTRLGYQGAAVDDIASAAGVTRTLIYKYFADKDEIYLSCVRTAREELETAFITAALSHTEPADQLLAGLESYFTFVRDRGQRWDMLFGGGSAVAGALAEHATQLRYETAEKIAELVRAAAPHIDDQAASAYAHAVSGAAEQLAKWWRQHPEISLEITVERCYDVVWRGLGQVIGPPG